MRIAVIGAGGIGGYYGSLLARAGEPVVFLARGAHLAAMRSHGLTLRTATGESTLAVAAVDDAAAIGPVDLVLFCVKTQDTPVAAQSLQWLVTPETTVLTLQNGLDNVETIASAIGPDRILVGSVHVALQIVAPGVILHSAGEGKIVFGEPAGPPTPPACRLAALFERAAIPHELSAEMPRVLWEKFLFIAGIGGMTALARSGIGRLLDDPEGRAILRASCAEIVAVADAEGVPLGSEATDRALHLAEGLPPEWRSSMARDVAEGRRIEVDALSGAVVRRGRKHNIPTPIHQVILGCLSAYEAGVLARS